MGRLTNLKPRVATLSTQRVSILAAPGRPDATQRVRGRRGVQNRERWLTYHPFCAHCAREGITKAAKHVDHITPLWAGGADDESNKQSLCIPHHKLKSAAEAKARGGG